MLHYRCISNDRVATHTWFQISLTFPWLISTFSPDQLNIEKLRSQNVFRAPSPPPKFLYRSRRVQLILTFCPGPCLYAWVTLTCLCVCVCATSLYCDFSVALDFCCASFCVNEMIKHEFTHVNSKTSML